MVPEKKNDVSIISAIINKGDFASSPNFEIMEMCLRQMLKMKIQ